MDSGYTVSDTEVLQHTRPVMLGATKQTVTPGQRHSEASGLLLFLRDNNPLMLRMVNMAMTLVYAVVANSFFRVTDCVSLPVPGASVDSPHVSVLQSDTSIVCYQDDHVHASALAFVCLAVFLLAWPVATFVYLFAVRLHNSGRLEFHFSARTSPWAFFCGGDYKWDMFFFRHALLVVVFVLAYVITRALRAPLSSLIITEVVLGVYLAALLIVRPYAESKKWKFPIHVLVVFVAMLLAVLNYVVYVLLEDLSFSSRPPSSSSTTAVTGLSWAVFGLVVTVFVALLLAGWWYLLQGADRHAEDLRKAVGVNSGSSRVVFNSIRFRRNPMKPRQKLRRSIKAVVAGMRMKSLGAARASSRSDAVDSPGQSGAASGTAHDGAGVGLGGPASVTGNGRVLLRRGAPSLEVNMDKRGHADGIELTNIGTVGMKQQQQKPQGGTTMAAQAARYAIVRTGTEKTLVPMSPATAKASDSPTGKIHEALSFAASKAPMRFFPHHTRGGPVGGQSAASSPRAGKQQQQPGSASPSPHNSPAGTPRLSRRSSSTGRRGRLGAAATDSVDAGSAATTTAAASDAAAPTDREM
jgi:hypothetical protein